MFTQTLSAPAPMICDMHLLISGFRFSMGLALFSNKELKIAMSILRVA